MDGQRSVLVLEADLSLLTLISVVLTDGLIKVFPSMTIPDAVRIARREEIELVLLDIDPYLVHGSLIPKAEEIVSMGQAGRLVCLASDCSAEPRDDRVVLLSKPFGVPQLISTVESCLAVAA